jgi:hypothetical protein
VVASLVACPVGFCLFDSGTHLIVWGSRTMQLPSQCRTTSAFLGIILFATLGCQSGNGSTADGSMGGSCVMPSQPAGAACGPEAVIRSSHEVEAWTMMTRRRTQSSMNVKRTGSHTLQVRFPFFYRLHELGRATMTQTLPQPSR